MSDDKKKSVWTGYSAEERAAVDALARGYIDFLSDCKTERESVTEAVRRARAAGYREEDGQRVMKEAEISVRVDMQAGCYNATVYTCDFTKEYVAINADYRS